VTPEFTALLTFKAALIKLKWEWRKKFEHLFTEYLEDTVKEAQQDVDDRIATLKETLSDGNENDT